MSDLRPSEATFSAASSRIAALRRVSGTEVVDQGIQLARQNYGPLLLAALAPTLPHFGITLWNASHRQPVNQWPTLLVSLILTTIFGAVASAAAARVAMDALEGLSPDPARALGIALRRAWPVVVTGLFQGVVVLIGSVLLLIPGLYALSIYALVPALPVLESGGALQALHRSEHLTEGSRMLAFGAYVVPVQFIFVAGAALNLITVGILGPHAGHLFGGLLATTLSLASIPFLAAIKVRMYVELRMRKEAIDIEWALAPTAALVVP